MLHLLILPYILLYILLAQALITISTSVVDQRLNECNNTKLQSNNCPFKK